MDQRRASDNELEVALRAGGRRITRPRTAVWSALSGAGGHLTAEEVATRVAEQDDQVNLASVYRTLTLFEELDLVRQSHIGDDPASRWELTHPDEHFHLVCTECGSVDHHVGTLVQSVRDHLAAGHGFVADQVDLTVRGRCSTCAPHDNPAKPGLRTSRNKGRLADEVPSTQG